ncbi:AAEL014603-PA [Aedes aegypti]|uniref:AAEL014603-PA n=2 Tax=Aedes aegypti TaxID=7159 RepID=A0A1S4G2S2_AEDAE|nr:cytochrome P450 9e2 [Aedes aegypti]EAT33123.1 AAEL014603-PA [Aedes aegypti]
MEVNLLLLATVITVFVYLYRLITKNNDYFHDKPIPSLKARPLLGSTGPLLLKQVTFADFVSYVYNKFPGVKVLGMFDTLTPFFVIRDPELIKQIAVKDFDHFMDHRPFFGESAESEEHPYALFKRVIFALNGQRWRNMRATLSPAFTGRKMRLMFTLMVDCSERMLKHYESLMSSTGRMEVEIKDMLSRYGINVIASCAFGIDVDCFKDVDHEFMYHGRRMLQMGNPVVIAKMLFMRMFPNLAKKSGMDVIPREQAVYFTKLIKETIRTRESQGIVRNDMIDLLLEARKGTLKYEEEREEVQEGFATVQESDVGKAQVTKAISEIDMIAQCLIFFIAGFESVSTTSMFMIYELILNPEIQQKLYEEVEQTYKQLGDKLLTYDALQSMKYMDMVVSETMRKWPLSPIGDRICVRDYTLDDGQGLRFTIDKGTCVWFPIHGLHHDPQYYPNPDRFDPERFNDQNKGNIKMGTYLPFGIGPRNCIGSRFALMELKAVMYHMLRKFSFHRSTNTRIPLKLRKGMNNVGTDEGMHVELRLRNS